jgi:tetratricopeptide (TPR) repeat protein
MSQEWAASRLLGAAIWCATLVPAAAQAPTPTPVRAPTPDAAELMARAVALHQAGDIVGAVDAYRQVLKLVPDSAGVHSNLGAALSHLGRYEEAIEEYRQALRVQPNNPDYRFNLALALYKSARLDEAAAEFERVLAARPDSPNATLLLADCRLQLGETRKVIELLSPHEASFADNDAFAYILGTALIAENDLERGQAVIDRLLRKGSAEAHLLMAAAHIKAKDFEHAGEELRLARRLNPRLPGLNFMQGQCLMGSRDWEGAARAFRAELDINPNHFEACLMLGTLRKDEGRYDDALQYLKRATQMRSGDTRAMYSLAGIYVATGQFEEARKLLEEVARLVPDNEQTHVSLATVYFRLNRPQDAERERALVRKLNEQSVARARAETERAQQARKDAEGGEPAAAATPSPQP